MTNDDFHTVLSVAHQQGVKVMDIFTATRKAPIVRARQLAMYALRLKG
jgi:chromosomal replication initiation ATPase DnaA